MTTVCTSRRTALLGLTALAALAAQPLRALAEPAPVAVLKAPGCTCCEAWAETLKAAGLAVTVEEVDDDALEAARVAAGVPDALYGCHMAQMGDLVIEGHVPAADILRAATDAPDVVGLSVTGMPAGSPGMEMGDMREAFDVVLWRADGSTEVFARHPGA